MTDTELLRKIIKMVFDTIENEYDWDSILFDAIYVSVRNTDYYLQLKKELKNQKLNELKQKQKRVADEAQRLMIEIQNLEGEN